MTIFKTTTTSRGFQVTDFDDANDHHCTLQQSSATDGEHPPGASYVWLGCGDQRMHLDRDMAAMLSMMLQSWVLNGDFIPENHEGSEQ